MRGVSAVRGWCAVVVLALGGCGSQEEAPAPAPPVLVVVTPAPTVAATPRPGVARRYVVRAGDTLSAIASAFGVTEDAIAAANGLDDRDQLYAGQELLIPPPVS